MSVVLMWGHCLRHRRYIKQHMSAGQVAHRKRLRHRPPHHTGMCVRVELMVSQRCRQRANIKNTFFKKLMNIQYLNLPTYPKVDGMANSARLGLTASLCQDLLPGRWAYPVLWLLWCYTFSNFYLPWSCTSTNTNKKRSRNILKSIHSHIICMAWLTRHDCGVVFSKTIIFEWLKKWLTDNVQLSRVYWKIHSFVKLFSKTVIHNCLKRLQPVKVIFLRKNHNLTFSPNSQSIRNQFSQNSASTVCKYSGDYPNNFVKFGWVYIYCRPILKLWDFPWNLETVHFDCFWLFFWQNWYYCFFKPAYFLLKLY